MYIVVVFYLNYPGAQVVQCNPGLPPTSDEHSLTEHHYIPTLMDDNEDDNEDKTQSWALYSQMYSKHYQAGI